MVTKKDLIIVALATFCLTATLFVILPSRSTPDPWADVTGPNGVLDDIVNMRDIQYEIIHFNDNLTGTTRQVVMANPPFQILKPFVNEYFTAQLTEWTVKETQYLFVGGFSTMSVVCSLYFPNAAPNTQYLGKWDLSLLSRDAIDGQGIGEKEIYFTEVLYGPPTYCYSTTNLTGSEVKITLILKSLNPSYFPPECSFGYMNMTVYLRNE